MKRLSNFFILVISLILGCSSVVACTLGILHNNNLSNPDEDTTYQNEDLSDLISEPLSPIAQHQIKFNAYNFVSDELPEVSTLRIYSEKQTQKFTQMREEGVRQSLSLEEILFLINDSARIYYQYDEVVLTNAYKHEVFERYEGCPDSLTLTTYHSELSELPLEEAAYKRAQIVEDIYKIFFYRCFMYDTWLMEATESYWSAFGIYHEWGNFTLSCREYEENNYRPRGKAVSYIKYLNETQFTSYQTYLDELEIRWDQLFNKFESSITQPLVMFVRCGVRIYYPDGTNEAYYVGDLVDSPPKVIEYIGNNFYKFYGYKLVKPGIDISTSINFSPSEELMLSSSSLTKPLFSEKKMEKSQNRS